MAHDKSSMRRICGIAAVSVTALGSLIGAPSAGATEAPGQALQELKAADPGTSASYFFKQGWPIKWEAERQVYQWWQKVESDPGD